MILEDYISVSKSDVSKLLEFICQSMYALYADYCYSVVTKPEPFLSWVSNEHREIYDLYNKLINEV